MASNGIALCTLLVFIILTLHCTRGNIRWIGVQNYPENEVWEKSSVCTKANGFTNRQVKFCRKRFPWMLFAHDAAKDTADECQALLKDHRWNCQSINKAPLYNADLKKDTKESALVHSLSTSSLALTVSRGCMAGKLKECSCQKNKRQASFPSDVVDKKNSSVIEELVGCRNILQVGQKFAHQFMYAGMRAKPKTERRKREIAIRRHNINVGLKEVNKGEYISCTCNGATAGCVMKFCHRRLVLLQDVSERLFEKYLHAKKAQQEDFVNVSQLSNTGAQKDFYSITKVNEDRMLYLDNDVNYCETNKGQYSSTGRRCSLDDKRTDSCKRICCGKGYRERQIEIHAKCRCTFDFCCKVKCDTCKRFDTIFECS